jgi:hypothetical protein
MNKFSHPEDGDYKLVKSDIQNMYDKAPDVSAQRTLQANMRNQENRFANQRIMQRNIGGRETRTYRVKNIPSHLDKVRFKSFLASWQEDNFGSESDIEVHSLAQDLHDEYDSMPISTQVATVSFKKTPTLLDNDEASWILPTRKYGFKLDITFDIEFYGFTPLNNRAEYGKDKVEYGIREINLTILTDEP